MADRECRDAKGVLRTAAGLRRFKAWARLRVGESSTWAGLAMIAVVLGSDPMQSHALAQAVSLIIGGGLVAAGPMPGSGVPR
jgi:hypothetical protein